jgi:inositol transport system substrate-binding protein
MKLLLKKLTAAIAVFAMVAGIFSGCGSKSQSSGKSSKILFLMTDTKDTFRKTLADAIVDAGKSAGVTIDMVKTGDSVEAQAKAVAEAKSKGYGSIILRLADGSTALQMNVASNGLPIVYVNSQPDISHLTPDKYIYVGSDEKQAGQYQAEYVLKKLNNPKSLNVIIFEGEQGHSGTIGRTSAVKKTLKKNGCDADYVFVDYANWSDTEAQDEFNIFMKTGQSVDAIFCNNDTMALGAVKGLKENGLDPSQIPVTGVDATADGCKSISDGGMQFTVLQNAKGQAKKAVEAAQKLGSGGSLKKIKESSDDLRYIWVPFEPVDSSNVNKYM